jgi:nucleotide-binding universal stress UspA family protein
VVNRQVRFGSAAEEIERAIVANQVDLVAMTTHARTGLSKLLYGSIAEHLLHHAKVPILLLHPAE